MRVLCGGDEFITGTRFAEALAAELGADHQYVTQDSAWPTEPMQDGGGVQEWAGDEARIAELASTCDLLVTHLAPVTRRVLEAGDALRFVGISRGGPVNVDLPAATERGVVVASLPGRNARAVAEFAVGAMVAGPRSIAWSASRMREGDWTGELFRYDRTGRELAGSTVGLVGLGEVSLRVADLLRAFGSHVLAHDPYVDVDTAAEHGVELVALDELLARSDVVSLHARLTDETRGLFGADAFSAMRDGAYLVNTARGELVDEVALADALRSGHLAGAALDVWDPEPPAADNPLLAMPQVLATSHVAGASQQVAHRAARRIAAEAGRFVRGDPVRTLANPGVVPRGEG